jgi:hypothetical protein
MQHDREIRQREEHKLCSIHNGVALQTTLDISRQPSLHPDMVVSPRGIQDAGRMATLLNSQELNTPPINAERKVNTVPKGFKSKKNKTGIPLNF